MTNRRLLLAAALAPLGLLAACGGAGEEPEESLAAPMQEAIDRAEAVESRLMEHKQAIDEALEPKQDDERPPP
ncbi:MAG TPA: hypothetical protein VKZ85_04925 [Woeseiaceae bacterium]|nr:hypothetical protein [Woeseiaceae bacterium]